MAKIRIARRAWADMLAVKAHTLDRFGVEKLAEYEALIADALDTIADDPHRGKLRTETRPGILAYHIGKRGRRARHVIFYRVAASGVVEVVRFLHDAMDFASHLPEGEP